MRNTGIGVIIGISLIICAYIVSHRQEVKEKYTAPSSSSVGRYEVIVSSDQAGKSLTIKYDTVTGQTWRLVLPQTRWVEIKDYGWLQTESK